MSRPLLRTGARNISRAFCLTLACSLAGGAACASEIRPLYSFNQSPLVQIYGLPALGEARVLNEGESTLTLRFQIANNFTGAQNTAERLNLDGETHRPTLAWRQGLPRAREWGIELPYLSHSGGFLDSTIDRFHQTFNMKEGGRPGVSRNQIDYRYSRNGVDRFRLSQPVSGVGDVRLSVAQQLKRNSAADGDDTTLRISLKLPTGDEAKLLGSGGTDLAIWLSAAAPRSETWNLYGGGGLLWLGDGKVLPSQQRNGVVFGTAGVGWRVSPRVVLQGQLDGHSPFYEGSHFRQLRAWAVQGLMGVNWELAPRRFLEFSISEDLAINTSSDVVFNLSLTLSF